MTYAMVIKNNTFVSTQRTHQPILLPTLVITKRPLTPVVTRQRLPLAVTICRTQRGEG